MGLQSSGALEKVENYIILKNELLTLPGAGDMPMWNFGILFQWPPQPPQKTPPTPPKIRHHLPKSEIKMGGVSFWPQKVVCHRYAKVFPKVHMKAQLTTKFQLQTPCCILSLTFLVFLGLKFTSPLRVIRKISKSLKDFPYSQWGKYHGSIFKTLTREYNTKIANSFLTVSRGLRCSNEKTLAYRWQSTLAGRNLRFSVTPHQIGGVDPPNPPKCEIKMGGVRIRPPRVNCDFCAKVFPKVHMITQWTSMKEFSNSFLYSLLNVFSISQLKFTSPLCVIRKISKSLKDFPYSAVGKIPSVDF